MIKSFVAFVVFCSCSTAFAAAYECRKSGEAFHPFDASTGRFVGNTENGGFSEAACLSAIDSALNANNGVMCAWNWGGSAPFNLAKNQVVGESDISYRFLSDCLSVASRTSNGKLCSYTGWTWLAYDIVTNSCEEERRGYRTFDECYRQISMPTDLSCRWNHFTWQPYHVSTGFIGLERYGFNYVGDCHTTISMSRKNAVCNWDGVGFRAYDIATNATLSTVSYGTLRSCYDSLGD